MVATQLTELTLFDELNELIILLADDLSIAWLNQPVLDFFHFQKDTVVNENYVEFYKKNNYQFPIFLNDIKNIINIKSKKQIEKITYGSTIIEWEWVSLPENKNFRLMLIGRDKTDYERMLIDKQDIEIRIKSTIDVLPGNYWWKDLNGRYLGCNENVSKTLLLPGPNYVIGKTDYELPWAKYADELVEHDNEVLHRKKIVTKEENVLTASGELLNFLVVKTPLYNSEKKIIGTIGASLDITAQKQLAEEQKEKEVLKKQVELSEMIGATVAHEVRTPLGAVQMATSVIAEAIEMGDMRQVEKSCQEIRRHLQRANTFIETFLLNVKRIHSISTDEISSIKTTIETVLANYVYPTPADRALVSLEPDFIDFEYGCSPSLMEHVFSNLLKNALYFIKKAGKGEIQIWSSREDGFNCVHFKDTGFGIPPEKIQHIFDKFYTSTKVGTGVGLSFCKMIMDSIGGKIICKSIFGEFTEFKLYFPKIDLK